MRFALDNNGERIEATPGTTATCPLCAAEVVAKCGAIKVWHWAHRTTQDCDAWSEGETPWHLYWKSLVPAEWTEVVVDCGGLRHRADIAFPDGTIVELQHSSIPPAEIKQRELFYGRLVWLFDATGLATRKLVWSDPSGYLPPIWSGRRLSLRKKEGYHTFRWKQPRKHIAFTTTPTYLDLGPDEGILRLKQMHLGPPCGGWGTLGSHRDFVSWLQRKTNQTRETPSC